MRITKLTAENFKRLKAVSIDPDDHTVVIAGRNAQGKSSVLDAIQAALAGRAGAKTLTRPIRDGESKARVVVELDDLVVERRWTAGGTSLAVTPKGSNAKLNSPQAVLDRLIGSLSFDPLAFAEAEPKQQVETLIDLIGREAFDEIAAQRKAAYDARTEANREVKSLRAQFAKVEDAEPAEPVDFSGLSAELEASLELDRARAEYERIEEEIAALREKQERVKAAGQAIIDTHRPRPSSVVRAEMDRAAETNQAAQRWIDRQAIEAALNEVEASANAHTTRIENLDHKKARLIEEANLPVAGLAFDEDGVTLNGVPFTQASAAERLKVSVSMAMALNPDLRVICIRDASLLDADSKRALVALAEKHDYQIWYEVVGDGGEIGVIIEDGEAQA